MPHPPAGLALSAVLLLALTACVREAPPAAATPSLTVSLVKPIEQDVVREVQASGTVAAWEEIQVGSELSGVRVDGVAVEVGDIVREGDVLVRLDSRTATADLARAEAAVAEARAALALAEARSRRTKTLAADALVAAQDVDDVVANETRARAQLDTAVAARDTAALRVDFAVIRAPRAGIVAARTVQPGQLVGNAELLRLIRDGRLEWRAELDERDLLRVRVGAAVSVTAADGTVVTGRVQRIAPGLDPARRTGTVFVALPSPGTLRAGTFAEGRVMVGAATAITVPSDTVVRRDGRAYVFLVDDQQRARERVVELGRPVGSAIEVTSGVTLKDALVARGAGFLNDGDLVRVADDAAAAPAPRAPGGAR